MREQLQKLPLIHDLNLYIFLARCSVSSRAFSVSIICNQCKKKKLCLVDWCLQKHDLKVALPARGKFSRFHLFSMTGSFIEASVLFYHSLCKSDRIQNMFVDHFCHLEKPFFAKQKLPNGHWIPILSLGRSNGATASQIKTICVSTCQTAVGFFSTVSFVDKWNQRTICRD